MAAETKSIPANERLSANCVESLLNGSRSDCMPRELSAASFAVRQSTFTRQITRIGHSDITSRKRPPGRAWVYGINGQRVLEAAG